MKGRGTVKGKSGLGEGMEVRTLRDKLELCHNILGGDYGDASKNKKRSPKEEKELGHKM